MPELLTFAKHAVPREIAAQVRSYVRVQWPHLDGRGGKVWDVAPGDAVSFVIVEDEVVVSYAEVKRKDFDFEGRRVKVLGLSAVFTYPAWRGAGFGREVVRAASEHMLKDREAEAGILFCAEGRVPLYAGLGWLDMATTTTLEGDAVNPTVHGCRMMFLPITESGRAIHRRFQNNRVYVGTTTW